MSEKLNQSGVEKALMPMFVLVVALSFRSLCLWWESKMLLGSWTWFVMVSLMLMVVIMVLAFHRNIEHKFLLFAMTLVTLGLTASDPTNQWVGDTIDCLIVFFVAEALLWERLPAPKTIKNEFFDLYYKDWAIAALVFVAALVWAGVMSHYSNAEKGYFTAFMFAVVPLSAAGMLTTVGDDFWNKMVQWGLMVWLLFSMFTGSAYGVFFYIILLNLALKLTEISIKLNFITKHLPAPVLAKPVEKITPETNAT